MTIWLNKNAINSIALWCLLCGLTHELMGSLCAELVMSIDRKRKSVGRRAICRTCCLLVRRRALVEMLTVLLLLLSLPPACPPRANLGHLLIARDEEANGKFAGWRRERSLRAAMGRGYRSEWRRGLWAHLSPLWMISTQNGPVTSFEVRPLLDSYSCL